MSLMCSKLMYHYHKQGPKHFPAYRDILFLAMLAAEKDTVDLRKYSMQIFCSLESSRWNFEET